MPIKTSIAVDNVLSVGNQTQTIRLIAKDLQALGTKYFEGALEIQSNITDREFTLLPAIGYICLISDRPFTLKLDNTTATSIPVKDIFIMTTESLTKFYISNPDLANIVNITMIVNS